MPSSVSPILSNKPKVRQLDFQPVIYENEHMWLARDPMELTDQQGLEAINNLVRYYRNNRLRMNYPQYLRDGLPIGNGVAESSHRHALQVRMKRAGQRWSLPKGRRMARLRASNR